MQHVLIPTDFSSNAWNATAYALQFFENEKITFHFLHIDISFQRDTEDRHLVYAGFSIKTVVSEAIYDLMEAWMQKVITHFPNPNYTLKHAIQKAPFVNGVRDYIEKKEIQFIVMGTKGASGLKEMTIGSKTGAVITRVKCPILIIPEKAKFKTPVNIGFPTDFNLLYKHRVIHTLLTITNVHNSSVKVLRVAQTDQPLDNFQSTNRDVLKNELNAVPHSFHLIDNPNLEHALQSFVNTMQIDMVAMIAKNLNFFERILFKPQVAKISYHMQIPFLVLHE